MGRGRNEDVEMDVGVANMAREMNEIIRMDIIWYCKY